MHPVLPAAVSARVDNRRAVGPKLVVGGTAALKGGVARAAWVGEAAEKNGSMARV